MGNGIGFAFFAWIRGRGRWQQCDGTGWRCEGCRNDWTWMQRWADLGRGRDGS